jgi:hypothetical protein
MTSVCAATRFAATIESARKDKNAMVFVPATDVVQANLRFTLLDQQLENTLYFEFDNGGVQPADMQTLGTDLILWWGTHVAPAVVDDVFMREVYLTDLSSQTAPTVTVVPGTNVTGGGTAAPLPNNVALCVSFRTEGRGRSARGRNYISGHGENAVSGNTFTSTISNSIRDAYEELLDATTYTGSWTWVVLSRFEDGQPRLAGLVQPVTAVVLTDTTVDSQRRRLPGRGR